MKKNLLFLSSALALTSTCLHAQSVWNGTGSTNWSNDTATGWNGTGVPNAIDATANINTGSAVITVDGTYTLGTLTSVAQHQLNSSSGTLIFDVSSGSALFDFTNGLTSGAGTIGGGWNHAVNLTLNDNTEFRGLVSTGSTQPTFSGKISGTGAMLLTNVATTPSGGALRIDLRNGTNDFSGGINVGQGVGLRLNASGAAGSGTITLADSAAGGLNNLDFRADTGNATQVHANNINFGTRASGGSTILTLQSTSNVTLNGVLSGAMGSSGRASLNGGTLVLGGASPNTWTGQFRSDTGGTIIADKVGAISNGFSMRSQTTDGTTALLVGVTDTLTGQISLDGNNSGVAFAYTAKLGLKDGNNGTVTFNSGSSINMGNVLGTGGGTNAAPTPNAVNLVLHSGNGNGTLKMTTLLTDNGLANARGIEITGTGTVNLDRLTGNTYNGATKVTGGTLLASNTSGSATGTGAVTVSTGATLGGPGIISGAVNITGVLSPGSSAGVLTVNNNVTLNNLGALAIELNGTAVGSQYDSLALGGAAPTLSLSGINNLNLALGYVPLVNDLFFIADVAGSNAISGVFEELNGVATTLNQDSVFTLGGSQFKISYTGDRGANTFSGGGNDLALQVIPEPSAVLLGGLGMLALLRRRRNA